MPAQTYRPGDYSVRCQRTGFKMLRSQCRREWTGYLVRNESFEMRHPQDFVRGRPDRQAAEDPSPDYDYTANFLADNEVKASDL